MATYVPVPASSDLQLSRRSSQSYDCTDIPALLDWLTEHGYRPIPTKSGLEYARLRRGDELVVLYNSGTALCQGANAAGAFRLLSELEVH